MKDENEAKDYMAVTPEAGPFFGKLLESVTVTHILHLQAQGPGSFSRHMALEAFYNEISDLADQIIEEYQGCYDLITDYKRQIEVPSDALEYIEDLYEFVQEHRYEVSDETHIQNRIDEICGLIARTKYKLRFLE
jgi:DNA-binding ferritin-like protein